MKTYLICISLFFFSASSYSTQLDDSDLTLEQSDVIDGDLLVVNADSELSLELDAKITHEAAKGSDANLETIFQIEYELTAIASSDRKLYLVSRLNELKQHLLAKADNVRFLDIEKNNPVKRQSRPKSKRSAVSNSVSESDPPVLNSVEIDKVSIDVNAGPQTVTFTLDVSDESGIDWARSCLCLDSPSGVLIILRSADADGVFTLDLTSSTPSGKYDISTIQLYDTLGNLKVYGRSEIALLTGPSFVYLLGVGDEATNLTLTTSSGIKSVAENSEVNFSLSVENLASTPSGQLTFELK